MHWNTLKLGRVSWDRLADAEERAAGAAAEGAGTLICAEPEPTYTAGRGAPREELTWTEQQCRDEGIAIRQARRGGRWTYHGPGQMVIYPIASLSALGLHSKATRLYMERFREAVRRWLETLGVSPRLRDDRPFGIYCGEEKLAAFGVTLEGGVTRGGMALYLSDQNPGFRGLVPCGIAGERMTSLRQLGVSLPWQSAVNGLVPFLKEGLIPPQTGLTFPVQEEIHGRIE